MAPAKKTIHDIKIPTRSSGTGTSRATTKTSRASRKKVTPEPIAEIAAPRRRVVADQARVRVVPSRPIHEESMDEVPPRRRESHGSWGWVIAVLIIIIGGPYLYGKLFHSATIVINPRHTTVEANNALINLAKEPLPTEVPLVTMSISDTVSRVVRTTGSAEVSEKASGSIIVYNNFSTAPQKLLEETRFEAPDGKIYKTAKGNPVTIPGITNGKPGQITVTVYADQPGAEYNKELTDFTIPGFKGSSKYEKFYARSASPITGGLAGTQASVAPEDREQIAADIGTDLGNRLRAEALLQKTDDFIIIDQSSRITISEPTVTPSEDNPLEAEFALTGTYTALLVNKTELASRLAVHLVSGYADEPIAINNIDTLTITPVLSEGQTIDSLDRIPLTISGQPLFVFQIAEDQLRQELLGISRRDAQAVFAHYPSIDSARLVIKPLWRMRAPGDANSIDIRYSID